MGSDQSTATDVDIEDDVNIVLKGALAVRNSLIAFLIALGATLFLTGFLIDVVSSERPISAILAVLGVSIVLAGILGWGALKAIGYS